MPKNISQLLSNSSQWPAQEALKIINKAKKEGKKTVILEAGYGPSGLPHIGTFGEVVRLSFIRIAIKNIEPSLNVRLIVFSDDMDGMRKIPSNIPNPEMLKMHMHKPLTSVPDPFEEFESYGHYMNNKLCKFLDHFGFEYEFYSATDCYKKGMFNDVLTEAAKKTDQLKKLILPTLGPDRQSTYHPIMPIDDDSGCVIESGVISTDYKSQTIKYKDSNGVIKEKSFLNGNTKLQWKCDFGARWAAMDIDYEIYGKDHYPNEKIYQGVSMILGNRKPINWFYELFLDENGQKISKTKGNGIDIWDWLKYGNTESLSYFMYMKPKTAKRLFFGAIPKTMDEYRRSLSSYMEIDNEKKIESPIFYILNGEINPKQDVSPISFSLILNLVIASGSGSEEMIKKYVKKYDSKIQIKGGDMLDVFIKSACLYYKDHVETKKSFKKITSEWKSIWLDFISIIKSIDENQTEDLAKEIQNCVHDICRKNNIDSKQFFLEFYQSFLGFSEGPRLGSFAGLYGGNNFIKMIENRIL